MSIFYNNCFNPYFAGSSSGREPKTVLGDLYESFNPYFAGSSSGRFMSMM